jgi:type VI secretion system protein VasG
MSVNLKSLVAKLNDTSRAGLEAAAGLCLSRTHYDVEIEHFLMKLLDSTNGDFAAIMKRFEVDRSRIAAELTRSLDKLKSGNARTPALSPYLLKMFTEAWTLGSINFGAGEIRSGFVILSLAGTEDLARLMRDVSREFQKIDAETLRKDFQQIVSGTAEDYVASPVTAKHRTWINTRSTLRKTRDRERSILWLLVISKFARLSTF